MVVCVDSALFMKKGNKDYALGTQKMVMKNLLGDNRSCLSVDTLHFSNAILYWNALMQITDRRLKYSSQNRLTLFDTISTVWEISLRGSLIYAQKSWNSPRNLKFVWATASTLPKVVAGYSQHTGISWCPRIKSWMRRRLINAFRMGYIL